MASYHPSQHDWPEKEGKQLACLMEGCKWAMRASGIDTKGDIHEAFSRHLERHDKEIDDAVTRMLLS